MPKICSKVSFMIRAYIWFYRIFFITFGGITINSSNKLSINKYLKYYGWIGYIIATFAEILGYFYLNFSEQLKLNLLYNSSSDLAIIYYAMCLTSFLQLFHINLNHLFLNQNGFKFFEIFYQQKISLNKYKNIISIIWIIHILLAIIFVVYGLMTSELSLYFNIFYAFIVSMFPLFCLISIWNVSFLTWISSAHFYELLTDIKQDLIRELNKNSGNFIFKKCDNHKKNLIKKQFNFSEVRLKFDIKQKLKLQSINSIEKIIRENS